MREAEQLSALMVQMAAVVGWSEVIGRAVAAPPVLLFAYGEATSADLRDLTLDEPAYHVQFLRTSDSAVDESAALSRLMQPRPLVAVASAALPESVPPLIALLLCAPPQTVPFLISAGLRLAPLPIAFAYETLASRLQLSELPSAPEPTSPAPFAERAVQLLAELVPELQLHSSAPPFLSLALAAHVVVAVVAVVVDDVLVCAAQRRSLLGHLPSEMEEVYWEEQ